jgi:hypothetical protein
MSLDIKKEKSERDKIYGYWGVVKAFAAIAAISVISYKVLITPVDFTLDFPTLLSLLLAFFSVGLSALFYFKATETSNNFYDNTHKFTRDIAQLLAKMESGFGERLKHLDEGYSSVRDYIQTNGSSYSSDESKIKIEEEKELAKKTIKERDAIINDLLEKAHLEGEEKEKVIEQLNEKELELKESRNEIGKIQKQRVRDKMKPRNKKDLLDSEGFRRYIKEKIVNQIGPSIIIKGSRRTINNQLSEILDSFSPKVMNDLISTGIIDEEDDLTEMGQMFLKSVTKDDWE